MITQNELKYIKSLSQRKFRQKYNKFIAEGDKICAELLNTDTYQISKIYCTNEWKELHVSILAPFNDLVTLITPKDLARASQLNTANQVLMIMELPKISDEPRKLGNAVIYLDDVQDPGNVGTIIRIADWFGIKDVIRSTGTADFYSPKVVQATMASFANVRLSTCTLEVLRQAAPNHKTIGAVLGGQPLKSIKWPSETIIVMGNESKGVSEATLAQIDLSVMIGGSSNRLADSLNVGIATALMCENWFQSN